MKIPDKLRLCIEKLSRGIVFKRSIRTVKGIRTQYVSPEASLKYWKFDSLNTDVSLHQFSKFYVEEGSTVWDVGSNIGVFGILSAAAAGRTGKVFCIEPDPFLGNLIQKSINRSPDVDAEMALIPVSISDSSRISDFAIPERARASNHLTSNEGSSQSGSTRHTQKALTVTLDWLLSVLPAPDVIKLDIEGEEYKAISAANELLTKQRPILYMEVWENIADQVTNILLKNNYSLYDGDQVPHLVSVHRACWTTLAIPDEMVNKVSHKLSPPEASKKDP